MEIATLIDLGFTADEAKDALQRNNGDADLAVEYLTSRAENTQVNDPNLQFSNQSFQQRPDYFSELSQQLLADPNHRIPQEVLERDDFQTVLLNQLSQNKVAATQNIINPNYAAVLRRVFDSQSEKALLPWWKELVNAYPLMKDDSSYLDIVLMLYMRLKSYPRVATYFDVSLSGYLSRTAEGRSALARFGLSTTPSNPSGTPQQAATSKSTANNASTTAPSDSARTATPSSSLVNSSGSKPLQWGPPTKDGRLPASVKSAARAQSPSQFIPTPSLKTQQFLQPGPNSSASESEFAGSDSAGSQSAHNNVDTFEFPTSTAESTTGLDWVPTDDFASPRHSLDAPSPYSQPAYLSNSQQQSQSAVIPNVSNLNADFPLASGENLGIPDDVLQLLQNPEAQLLLQQMQQQANTQLQSQPQQEQAGEFPYTTGFNQEQPTTGNSLDVPVNPIPFAFPSLSAASSSVHPAINQQPEANGFRAQLPPSELQSNAFSVASNSIPASVATNGGTFSQLPQQEIAPQNFPSHYYFAPSQIVQQPEAEPFPQPLQPQSASLSSQALLQQYFPPQQIPAQHSQFPSQLPPQQQQHLPTRSLPSFEQLQQAAYATGGSFPATMPPPQLQQQPANPMINPNANRFNPSMNVNALMQPGGNYFAPNSIGGMNNMGMFNNNFGVNTALGMNSFNMGMNSNPLMNPYFNAMRANNANPFNNNFNPMNNNVNNMQAMLNYMNQMMMGMNQMWAMMTSNASNINFNPMFNSNMNLMANNMSNLNQSMMQMNNLNPHPYSSMPSTESRFPSYGQFGNQHVPSNVPQQSQQLHGRSKNTDVELDDAMLESLGLKPSRAKAVQSKTTAPQPSSPSTNTNGSAKLSRDAMLSLAPPNTLSSTLSPTSKSESVPRTSGNNNSNYLSAGEPATQSSVPVVRKGSSPRVVMSTGNGAKLPSPNKPPTVVKREKFFYDDVQVALKKLYELFSPPLEKEDIEATFIDCGDFEMAQDQLERMTNDVLEKTVRESESYRGKNGNDKFKLVVHNKNLIEKLQKLLTPAISAILTKEMIEDTFIECGDYTTTLETLKELVPQAKEIIDGIQKKYDEEEDLIRVSYLPPVEMPLVIELVPSVFRLGNWGGTTIFRPLIENKSTITVQFDYTPSKSMPALVLNFSHRNNSYQLKNIIPLVQRVRIFTNITEDTLRRYDQEVVTDDVQPFIHLYLDLKRSPHLLVKKTGMLRFARSLDPTEHKAWGRSNTIALELWDNHLTNKVEAKKAANVVIPKFVQYGLLPTDWYKGGVKIEVLPKEREDVKATLSAIVLQALPKLTDRVRFALDSLVSYRIILLTDVTVNLINIIVDHNSETDTLAACDRMHSDKNSTRPLLNVEMILKQYLEEAARNKVQEKVLPFNRFWIKNCTVTPLNVYFNGPMMEEGNRVVRQFSDHAHQFMRVNFEDEDGKRISSIGTSTIEKLAGEFITGGACIELPVSGQRFDLFGYSNSQLRESKAWYFSESASLSRAEVNQFIGDLSGITNVAKYGARHGQGFSTSTPAITIPLPLSDHMIPDIERNGYCFSDGVGTISPPAMEEIRQAIGMDYLPSAVQFRFGGVKGVLTLDNRLESGIKLRKSQVKYESQHNILEVIGSNFSRYQPAFLNKQLVTILSTRGVPDEKFFELQNHAVFKLNKAVHGTVAEVLDNVFGHLREGIEESIVKRMLTAEFPVQEPFMYSLLTCYKTWNLNNLTYQSRIFLPESQFAIGVMDEYGVLEYGEVYFQSTCGQSQLRKGSSTKIIGKVFVVRSPCIHPGDVRVLTAVDKPELHHLHNVVVFPQKGPRPHPDESSGGDLDGDQYIICWNQNMIPPNECLPANFGTTGAREATEEEVVTARDHQNHFGQMLANNTLGPIADAWMVAADLSPVGCFDEKCLRLADLHNIAVDFPKTGIPAELKEEDRPKRFPDFMARRSRDCYPSSKILGKLYRKVLESLEGKDGLGGKTGLSVDPATVKPDPDCIVDGYLDYLTDAQELYRRYCFELQSLLAKFNIDTEAELISGKILARSKKERKEYRDLNVSIQEEWALLFRNFRQIFENRCKSDDSELAIKRRKQIASAWYMATYTTELCIANYTLSNNHTFLSFPWIAVDVLCNIKVASVKKGDGLSNSNGLRDSIFSEPVVISAGLFGFVNRGGFRDQRSELAEKEKREAMLQQSQRVEEITTVSTNTAS